MAGCPLGFVLGRTAIAIKATGLHGRVAAGLSYVSLANVDISKVKQSVKV